MTRLNIIIQRICNKLDELKASNKILLRQGASQNEISLLRETVGYNLPDDFISLYEMHNGQSGHPGLFFSYNFIPIDEVLFNWECHVGLVDEGFNDRLSETIFTQAHGFIQDLYLAKGWIPFAHDGAGNHLSVDLSPGPNGTYGQIINHDRDDDFRVVQARSMGEFLQYYLHRLEAIKFNLLNDEWIIPPPYENVPFSDWIKRDNNLSPSL
jgi:internalin A